METLRTPDAAFAAVPDFDHPVVYTNVTADDGTVLRVAHVDAGPANAANTVLCMHEIGRAHV